MFNVIPPISHPKVGFNPQNNKFSQRSSSLAQLNADTVSFTGVQPLEFAKIRGNFLEASLSLSELKVSKLLRSAAPEEYMHLLSKEIAEIAAKRLDVAEIVKKAESGSFSHPPHLKLFPGKAIEPSSFTFHPAKKPGERYTMDWTKEYNAIRNVFESTGEKDSFKPTKYNFDAAKVQLFEELKKLSLI